MSLTHPPVPGAVWRRGSLSVLLHRRSVLVGLALFGLVVAVGLVTLSVGNFAISIPDTVRTLLGNGSVDTDYVIFERRLPRLLTALAAGAAFGASGALFQSLTRNPLGSPDIIGFTAGASTGALSAFLLIGTTLQYVATGAIIGGLVSAAVVYGLAYRRGTNTYRLVLIGVAVQLLLLSTNTFLLMRADVLDAQSASWWLVGSLNGRNYSYAAIAGTAVVLLLPAALLLHRRCLMLELGDASARALGVPVERSRLAVVAVGVGLAAAATASVGPIAFVALAAPQLARRLTTATGPGVLPAALMGALLLSVSDLIAQHGLGEDQAPVGVVSSCLGGGYLIWMLSRARQGG